MRHAPTTHRRPPGWAVVLILAAVLSAWATPARAASLPFAPLPKPPGGYVLREAARLPGRAAQAAYDPRGGAVYVLGVSGDVWRVRPLDGRIETVVQADAFSGQAGGGLASGLAVDPRRGALFVAWNVHGEAGVRSVVYRAELPEGGTPSAPKPWLSIDLPAPGGTLRYELGKLAVGPDGWLYAGSRTLFPEAGRSIEPEPAGGRVPPLASCVWRVDPDGATPVPETFASGLCDPSGFCWDARGEMYALDDCPTVPGELNHLVRGRHYGFPYAYSNYTGKVFPRMPGPPPGVSSTRPLANLGPGGGYRYGSFSTFDARSSPSAIVPLGAGFPAADRGTFLVARFGNRERTPADLGFDLLQVRLRPGALGHEEAEVREFLAPLARPVDLCSGGRGRVFLCEDARRPGFDEGRPTAPGRLLELSVANPVAAEAADTPDAPPPARWQAPWGSPADWAVAAGLAYCALLVLGLTAFAAFYGGGGGRVGSRLAAAARFAAVSAALAAAVAAPRVAPGLFADAERPARLRAYEDLVNCRFTADDAPPGGAPRVVSVAVPGFTVGKAGTIGGAIGRDSRGHVWFAVSPTPRDGDSTGSARLFEYRPDTGKVVDRGDLDAGASPTSVVPKLAQGADGGIYFAAGGEAGGSHLWRVRLSDGTREHVLGVPGGITALAASGRYVFALGGGGTSIERVDCLTDQARSVRFETAAGRLFRSIVADDRGHVFATRLVPNGSTDGSGSGAVNTVLVEFDEALRPIGESVLAHDAWQPGTTRGVRSYQHLADRSIAVVSGSGYLYRIVPRPNGPSEVAPCGWFYPRAAGVRIALFAYDGSRYLGGLSMPGAAAELGGDRWEWVVYDLADHTARAFPIDGLDRLYPSQDGHAPVPVVTGWETRDDYGNFYLGAQGEGAAGPPVLLRLEPPAAARPAAAAIAGAAPIESAPAPAAAPSLFERESAAPAPEPADSTTEAPKSAAVAAAQADKPAPGRPSASPDDDDTSLDPARRRAEFRVSLRALLSVHGDRGGAMIERLCDRYGRGVTPEARREGTKLLAGGAARADRAARVRLLRSAGVPETVILDDLIRLEVPNVGLRGGPKDRGEAVVRAARVLLSVPFRGT